MVVTGGGERKMINNNCFFKHYKFSLPFVYAEMFQFVKGNVDTYFSGPFVEAPLYWQVSGIAGQTNTLSNPPLHVDHGNADYYVIVCCFRVDMVSLW